MNFQFTPEQERFRQDVRGWLAAELSDDYRNLPYEVAGVPVSREFSRKLGEKGWIGLAWPREYGGQALGNMEFLIYREEMVKAGAPIAYHLTAENQMAPSIMLSGTEEQKRAFIPRIASGELSICIGSSEPGAGSDLAALETRADRDGDDFIIKGAKTWNSGARHSQYVWLAARTNQQVAKHQGISVFLVDLSLPGVGIRPIVNMAGIAGFSTITFDNVRVPKSAMVGEEDRGWYVVAQNLDFERSGIERVASNYPVLRDFVAFIKEAKLNGKTIASRPEVRHRVAEMFIELEVGTMLAYNIAWMQSQGRVPNREASISKVFGAETTQRNARAMLETLGLYGQLVEDPRRVGAEGSPYAPLQGRVLRSWYWAVSATIAAGASEIQRNIIAQRGLGLPRG